MDSSPQEHVNQLICGYWNSQCVYVAAKLGIADLLANGPLSIDDLADRTGMHPPSLFRVLRCLPASAFLRKSRANDSGSRPPPRSCDRIFPAQKGRWRS